MKKSKRYKKIKEKIDKKKVYKIEEAVKLAIESANAKFDEQWGG